MNIIPNPLTMMEISIKENWLTAKSKDSEYLRQRKRFTKDSGVRIKNSDVEPFW